MNPSILGVRETSERPSPRVQRQFRYESGKEDEIRDRTLMAGTRTAGLMLPHKSACALIREKARRAMERLPEFRPYRLAGPAEVKVELTEWGTRQFRAGLDVERLSDRTWVFSGKDIIDACRQSCNDNVWRVDRYPHEEQDAAGKKVKGPPGSHRYVLRGGSHDPPI